MRVGLGLPHYAFSFPGEELRWEAVLGAARWAEEAGFGAVWASDHYFVDIARYGGPAGPQACYDPLATLAALSAQTRSVHLGTLVLAVGLRPPSLLAKAAASLDRLSEGRFELGMGAGWNRPEYQAAGIPFPSAGTRLAQLAEAVQIVQAMGRDSPASFSGRHFRIEQAPNLPPPVRPIPIWIGAKGDRALRVAARHADGWNVVWRWTPPAYRERVVELERACAEVGRNPAEVRRSIGLIALVGEDRRDLERRFSRWGELAPPGVLQGVDLADFAADRLVGTPDQVLERLAAFREAGMQELVVNFAPLPFAWYPDSGRELFREAVLPVLDSWVD